MRRRFNYTGRRRIKQADVSFSITTDDDGIDRFHAGLDFSGYEFPGDGRVWIEAYDRDAIMRFPFGTVQSPRPETDTVLTAFPGNDSYYFRVKVVDQDHRGRLYGIADSISPVRQEQQQDAHTSLLRLSTRDLGPVPWKLEFFAADYPLLVINNQIDVGKSLARSNAFFQGAVFATLVERILRRILVDEEYWPSGEPEPEDKWKEAWIDFCGSFPGNEHLTADSELSKDEIEAWIEDTVDAFCRSFNPVRKLKAELRELDT